MNSSSSSDNKLTSERHAAFAEALELLYIKGNISGRIHFAKEWPAAALYVFGAELVAFDAQGGADKKKRAVLEEAAEERRIALAEIVSTLEAKSVDKGVLQLGYVETLVKDFGRDLALLLYAPRIVDRFIPPPPAPEPQAAEEKQAAAPPPVAVPPPPPVEEEISFPEDPLDQIKPISLEPNGPLLPRFEDLKKRRSDDTTH